MRSERGSVTVFAVGVLLLGFFLVVALAAVGQVLIARSRVVTAAEAARLVRANGAELLSCSCAHDPGYAPRTATVTVRLPVTVLGLGEMTLEATAAAEFRPVALLDGPELRPVAGRGTKVHPVPRPSR